FGIDRLSDGPKNLEAREVVFLRVALAPLHERTNSRRCGVKLSYTVTLEDVPQSIFGWKVGSPFVHQSRHSIRKNSIEDIAMAGAPADVGGAPKKLIRFWNEVEHVLCSQVRVDHVSAGRMHNPLGLSRGSRCVKKEEHALGIERLAGTLTRGRSQPI